MKTRERGGIAPDPFAMAVEKMATSLLEKARAGDTASARRLDQMEPHFGMLGIGRFTDLWRAERRHRAH